LNLEEFISRS